MEQNFKSGDVVMLKSGETGKIEKNEIDRNCFTLCQE